MKKATLIYLLSIVLFSGSLISEGFSTPPKKKKKTSAEIRIKKQNKKKKKKGDTTCPKIDC